MPIKKNQPVILVTGGAGYIGSHMVLHLLERGISPIVLDNLSSGHREAVLGGIFIEGDLSDSNELDALFQQYKFDAVMHFAAHTDTTESISNPEKYYVNNVVSTLNLLSSMQRANVKKLIFSSSKEIYGKPQYALIDELHPKNPINPYGKSKWMIEEILEDYHHAWGLQYISLRYFNAAGADPQGRIGEAHPHEPHLIPKLLEASLTQSPVYIYGNDYLTDDGTCIRDYIHVNDLCAAHFLAFHYLRTHHAGLALNLGTGIGHSVLSVIKAVEEVTETTLNIYRKPRRAGDPPSLVADSRLAQQLLNWHPYYLNIHRIIQDAYTFWKKHHTVK